MLTNFCKATLGKSPQLFVDSNYILEHYYFSKSFLLLKQHNTYILLITQVPQLFIKYLLQAISILSGE